MFERAYAGGKSTDRSLLFAIANGLLKNEYRDAALRQEPPSGRSCNAFEDRPMQGAADRARLLDPDGDWGSTQSPSYTFEDSIFAAEFDRAVRVLEPDPRDAFILGELRGLTTRETGAFLGTSHVTANTRRAIATDTIRKELTTA